MEQPPPIVYTRDLTSDLPAIGLPEGLSWLPFDQRSARAAHALLAAAYQNGFGSVPDFESWYAQLIADSEYDPELCFVAVDGAAVVAGFAQCWTSSFIKDLAVNGEWLGRGVGEALLVKCFRTFAARGAKHIHLKVVPGNQHAIALYERCGMVRLQAA